MTDDKSSRPEIYKTMLEIGLADPFIRGIVGVVAVPTAAGFVISILGDGTKAVIAVGLSLMFGVILAVLRVLIKNSKAPSSGAFAFLPRAPSSPFFSP